MKKPIIVLKGGKNEETVKAAASHTGSLAGSSKVYEAVFRQSGIIQTDDLIDLFNAAKLLEKEPLPKGNRVQIITNGGGFGIVTADQIISRGLQLAKPSKETMDKIRAEMPMVTSMNPLDLLGDADAKRYKRAIELLMLDDNVDILIVLALFNLPTLKEKTLGTLKRARTGANKPVVVCSIGSDYTNRYLKRIEKAGFATFRYPSVAAKALREMVNYKNFLDENRR
jgi:acyl-CoA synthetase (NDP forming)